MASIRGSKYIIETDAKVNINQLKTPQCAKKNFSESQPYVTYPCYTCVYMFHCSLIRYIKADNPA